MEFEFQQYLKKYREVNNQAYGCCPFHDDINPSFSANLKNGLWKCFGCNLSGDFTKFIQMIENQNKANSIQKAANYKRARFGIDGSFNEVATYIYQDSNGNNQIKVTRYEDPFGNKTFKMQHFNGANWVNGKCKKVVKPYLHNLWNSSDEIIFLVEGEKCAEFLYKFGIMATTTLGGANAWLDEYKLYFHCRKVVIIPDNDGAGIAYANQAFQSISSVAISTSILKLENLSYGEDVIDWLRQDNLSERLDELKKLAEEQIKQSYKI